jgi:hypothetical protein
VPATGDSGWGTNVSNLLIDLATSSKVLQTGSTTFTLTAGDVDFGATYGPKAAYYKSRSANPSAVGIVRLGNNESIAWRNQANSANLTLAAYTTDRLQYGGVDVPTISSSDTLTNKTISGSSNTLSNIAYASLTLSGSIVNADVSNSAAIAYSKLNLSSSIVNADIGNSAAIALSKIAGGTTGYIPFASSSTALSNDSNLYWDNTNKRLGLGHTPSYALGVTGEASSSLAGEYRLGYGSTIGGMHITSNDGSTQYGFWQATSSKTYFGTNKASSTLEFHTNGAAKASIDASGNFGIGTTAQDTILTIGAPTTGSATAAVGAGDIHLVNPDSVSGALTADTYGTGAVISGRRAQGTSASKTAIVNTATLLRNAGYGYDGTSAYRLGGTIDIMGEGTWTASSYPTALVFRTVASGSTTLTERVRIDNAGNLNVAGLTASMALVTDASKNLSSSAVTSTELGYVSGVTSAIQTQLNAKEATITTLPVSKGGTGSTTALGSNKLIYSLGGVMVESSAITGNRALISDTNGVPTHATTTATEIGYVNGVTSAIQTQIDGKVTTPTAWTSFDPATVGVTFTGGTGTSATNVSSAYKVVGKIMHVRWGFSIAYSSAPSAMTVTLPNSKASTSAYQIGVGRNTAQGYMLQLVTGASSATVAVFKYDNNAPFTATGDYFAMSLTLEIN